MERLRESYCFDTELYSRLNEQQIKELRIKPRLIEFQSLSLNEVMAAADDINYSTNFIMIKDLRPRWLRIGKNPQGKWGTGRKDLILLGCDKCNKEFERPLDIWEKLYLKRGKDLCKRCTEQLPMEIRFGKEGAKRYHTNMSKATKGKPGPLKGQTFDEFYKDNPEYAEKRKKMCSQPGKLNPMYGKVAKNSDGRGYNGWYKNFFFRSLLELSFIKYCEKNNIKIACAEHISIPYLENSTYHPDFIINNDTIIELKPLRLQNNEINKNKNFACIYWCEINNYKYKVLSELDFEQIKPIEFIKMIKDNEIKLTKRTEERIRKLKIWND